MQAVAKAREYSNMLLPTRTTAGRSLPLLVVDEWQHHFFLGGSVKYSKDNFDVHMMLSQKYPLPGVPSIEQVLVGTRVLLFA